MDPFFTRTSGMILVAGGLVGLVTLLFSRGKLRDGISTRKAALLFSIQIAIGSVLFFLGSWE